MQRSDVPLGAEHGRTTDVVIVGSQRDDATAAPLQQVLHSDA